MLDVVRGRSPSSTLAIVCNNYPLLRRLVHGHATIGGLACLTCERRSAALPPATLKVASVQAQEA